MSISARNDFLGKKGEREENTWHHFSRTFFSPLTKGFSSSLFPKNSVREKKDEENKSCGP